MSCSQPACDALAPMASCSVVSWKRLKPVASSPYAPGLLMAPVSNTLRIIPWKLVCLLNQEWNETSHCMKSRSTKCWYSPGQKPLISSILSNPSCSALTRSSEEHPMFFILHRSHIPTSAQIRRQRLLATRTIFVQIQGVSQRLQERSKHQHRSKDRHVSSDLTLSAWSVRRCGTSK